MVCRIKDLFFNEKHSDARAVVIIEGTDGDVKNMINEIRKLEVI